VFDKNFYKNKRVLLTGHTGFKGTWLAMYLVELGANVCGYALEADDENCLYRLSMVSDNIKSVIGDIRDYKKLYSVFNEFKPEIVIHLAAQPIVLKSYEDPKYTYETNVLGTLNLMECVKNTASVKSVLNVTTEKVYENKELFNVKISEEFPLDGYDPYSNSKTCSELITATYRRCFFQNVDCSISTARASNVIGGGDFADDRIIPDCVRAALDKKTIGVRNPDSSRPYQYVLDPLTIYLEICEKQYENKSFQGAYNVCPDKSVFTKDIVEKFCQCWGNGMNWRSTKINKPHEATQLIVANAKLKETFNWKQIYGINEAIKQVVAWTRVFQLDKALIPSQMKKEIAEFLARCFNV
jgi:CDP-glucose 4,6-dehydratase